LILRLVGFAPISVAPVVGVVVAAAGVVLVATAADGSRA
jgi:hypothetical protein